MAMNTTNTPIGAIPWYRLESYDAARGIMKDKDKLPPTYSAWRMQAEQVEKQMRRAGRATVRAYIEPADFLAWCEIRGLDIDSKARNLFAAAVANETAKNVG